MSESLWGQAYLVLNPSLSAIYFLCYLITLNSSFKMGVIPTLLVLANLNEKDNADKEPSDAWPINSL